MNCNDISVTQGYLEGDDPTAVTFGCMPSGTGEPVHVPNVDEIPFYFDVKEEKLYYYTCEPEMWTKVDSTLVDLKPSDITNLANPTENLKVPVVYEVGGTRVEGLVSLGELVEAIQNATNPVVSVEKNAKGELVVTSKDGKQEVIKLDFPSDLKSDGKGNLTFTKPDGTKETVQIADPDNFGGISDVVREGDDLVIKQGKNTFRTSLGDLGGISDISRDGDMLVIKQGTRTFRISLSGAGGASERPVNFAPSHDGKNIEITLADGSVLDMTRDEFADWLSGEDSSLATDDELDALKEELNQSFLDELNSRLASLDHDQAVLTSNATTLTLTNDDGSKSEVLLANLIKLSSDTGNLLEVRDNGLYYGVEAPPDLAKFYVDAEAGSDENEGTTATSPFRTLSKAFKSSPSNLSNTIYLKATTRNGQQQAYDWNTNHTVSGGATRRIQTYGQYHYNDSVMNCIKSKVAGGVGINFSEEWVRPILRPVWFTSSNPLRVQGFGSVVLSQGNISFDGVTFDINKSNIDTGEFRPYQAAFVRGSGSISMHSCRIVGNTDDDALGVYAKLYLADTGNVISISSRNSRVLSAGDEDPLTTPSLRGVIDLSGKGNGSLSYDDNYFQGLGITKEKILECGVPQAIVDNTNFVGGNIGTFFKSQGFISGVVTHSNGTPLNLSANFEIK